MVERVMKNESANHERLTDDEVIAEVRRLVTCEREATARLIAVLVELDERRLYLAAGCSSLFTYCTQVLYLSEHAAYGRIEAARAARKWPIVLELLADGSLHLTAIGLLGRHLTTENHLEVLATARHKSKRDIEEIVAALQPKPPIPSTIRKLPTPTSDVSASLPSEPGPVPVTAAEPVALRVRPSEIKPVALEQFKVAFTVSRDTYEKLREAQDLLRHRVPNGDVAVIVDRALTLLLAELHKTKHAAVSRPRIQKASAVHSRHVPASVKRAVWERDQGRCAFVGTTGRCAERGLLEYHHVVPFADGGATVVANLELRCRAHNEYEAERWFGVAEVKERPVCEFNAV